MCGGHGGDYINKRQRPQASTSQHMGLIQDVCRFMHFCLFHPWLCSTIALLFGKIMGFQTYLVYSIYMDIIFKANIQNQNLLYWSRHSCRVIGVVRAQGRCFVLENRRTLKNCWLFNISLSTYHVRRVYWVSSKKSYVVALEIRKAEMRKLFLR